MKKHEDRQHVGIDRTVLQYRRVRERRARMVQQNARIAVVCKTAAACEVNQDGAGEREQQKCDINVPASPQRPADHSGPALAAPCLAVGQRAGYARDEHEYFRGIAEAVVPQRQPTSDVVGNMVKKDAPQRDASAGIYSQVAALRLSAPAARRPMALGWLFGRASCSSRLERWADVGVFGVTGSHSETYDFAKITSQHERSIARSPKALPKKLRNQPNLC